MIGGKEGADPASVVYDAVSAAKARGVDVVICDTAGRLHNKKNLMEEHLFETHLKIQFEV